jgi:hypothetical protein
MHDLALSRADHDLVFRALPSGTAAPPKYEIVLMDTADRVAQQIKINLLAFLGEWFLDVTFGVPYLESILVKNPRMTAIETILRSHITSVPDVISCDTLSLAWDRKVRSLMVTFTASTNLGPIKESYKLEMQRNV